ncbi:Asd/ArgC dimerization domain-containing protein [Streptomyces sp. NPDC047928]|uniref:aspartate-semialdehyde dehydrogenase n=1 Tax=unclassified Streptomyces TaxID=2593676 RepID=UPI003721A08F
MSRKPALAVVGATGAAGAVMLQILSQHADIWGDIRLIASPRSAGRKLTVRGEMTEVIALDEAALDGVDVALFLVPEEIAAHWAPIAAAGGTVVVDASPAFRTDPDVPLVVPEINPHAVRVRPRGIVASPGCATLALIVAVGSLHAEFGLSELVVSTYQAASGVGQAGVGALREQLSLVAGTELGTTPGDVRRAVEAGGGPRAGRGGIAGHGGTARRGDAAGRGGIVGRGDVVGRGGIVGRGEEAAPFPAPLALNVVPWAGELAEDGWSSEELRIRAEARKILDLPQLRVAATCVRVPVVTAHSVSVHARFEREVTVARAHEILATSPGVVLYDDPAAGDFPTPADIVGTDPTWVGRVRRALDDPRALELFVCGDNLRKGAALNAAQVAEAIAAERLTGPPPNGVRTGYPVD